MASLILLCSGRLLLCSNAIHIPLTMQHITAFYQHYFPITSVLESWKKICQEYCRWHLLMRPESFFIGVGGDDHHFIIYACDILLSNKPSHIIPQILTVWEWISIAKFIFNIPLYDFVLNRPCFSIQIMILSYGFVYLHIFWPRLFSNKAWLVLVHVHVFKAI